MLENKYQFEFPELYQTLLEDRMFDLYRCSVLNVSLSHSSSTLNEALSIL